MPQLSIFLNIPGGGADVWDEEVTIENRLKGIIAINRKGTSDLEALAFAVGRTVWVGEKPQSANVEHSIGTDGPSILAQRRQASPRLP